MISPETATLAASMLEDNLAQSGRVGRTETKVLTYNGGYDGQESFISVDELEAVRIGDVIDPATIVKLAGVAGGTEREVPGDILVTQPSEENIIALIGYGLVFAYIVTGENAYDVSAGTYAVHHSDYHLTRIVTKTIHPIDQKYLPGVCLPVLELSEETCLAIMADSSGAGVQVTASEEAFFREVLAENVPCVVKASLSGVGALVGTYNVACDANLKPLLFSNLFLFTALVAIGDNGVVFSLSRNT